MHQQSEPSKKSDMSSAALDVDAMRTMVSEAQQGSRSAADRLVRTHEGWVRSVI